MLASLRKDIDMLDNSLLLLIEQRMEKVQQIGAYKRQHHLETFDPSRKEKVKQKRQQKSSLDPVFLDTLYECIHDYAITIQQK